MLASRSMKPKLSLSISTSAAATPQSKRPSLSLNLPSPVGPTMSMSSSALRSPISPSPISPTARNTRLNQRGYSTLQQPSFSYTNSYASSKSILKKSSGSSSAAKGSRRLQFRDEPTVHAITPIECEDAEGYYGGYGAGGAKMSREERRWARR